MNVCRLKNQPDTNKTTATYTMPKYKSEFRQAGATYTEIKRHQNIALFESDHTTPGYEVHVLRMKPAHPKSSEAGTKILMSPSSSEWGKFGFTFVDRDRAEQKFQQLAEARYTLR